MSPVNSMRKTRLLLLLAIIVGILSAWMFVKYRSIHQEPLPVSISTSTPQAPPVSTPTTTEPTSTTQETKTYRNTEWGFEFQYPGDWILKENTFRSYYSKFNLEIKIPKEKYLDLGFDVNVVLPEFAERSFRGLEKTISEVTVGSVRGIKYEYQFEGLPETAVILPFGELRMILGTGGGSKQYLDEFNQILASFKFLK